MGLKYSKSPTHIQVEKQLSVLAKQVHDVQYDLHHTSDLNFRHSIKNRSLFKLTRDLLSIQELIENDDVIESIPKKQRVAIQIRIDDLAWRIQEITTHN